MSTKFSIFLSLIIIFFITKTSAQGTKEEWIKYIENENITSPYILIITAENVPVSDLKDEGFDVIRKLKQNAYIVSTKNTKRTKRTDHEIFKINDQWKISPGIIKSKNPQNYIVRFNSSETKNKISSLKNVEVVTTYKENVLIIRCTYKLLMEEIIKLPGVIYVGNEQTDPSAESRVIDLNLNPNGINLIHHNYPELNGIGMTVSLKDQFYNIEDIDIINRHISSGLESSTTTNHATDMATVVAGAGNSFINGKGVAWMANLTSSDFNPVFPDDNSYYQNLNVRVQNHSYGTNIENFYGVLAEAFDVSANENPQLLHVFSSGNKGTADGTGDYEGINGYANLTGNYKMAKNILTVGAVDTVGRVMSFSSKGPAYDGRVKPELTAYSTNGTSSSTALVSGVSLLLQESYKEEFGEVPHSALIKGLLINTAEDVAAPGIDFSTGYGNMNAYKALLTLKGQRYFSGNIADGEVFQSNIQIPANSKELKITLVWNDPAALPNSELALVNDLDLMVSNVTTEWLPWVLNPTAGNITDLPERKEDHLNNVEHITIADPAAGIYTIEISGFDIPQGHQEYYVIYSYEIGNNFKWLFPTGSNNMPYDGETTSYFRWKSTLVETNGTLEYSIDKGNSWNVIDTDINLETGHYRWEAPEVFSSAIARMKVGEQIFTSDTFTISTPLRINVGFNCGDSVFVSWKPVNNVDHYDLFTVGEMFPKKFASTSDTFHIYKKGDLNSTYVAVQPVLNSTKELIRSYMFNVELQGIGCYIRSFLSEGIDDEGVYLTLNLGTAYGVDDIFFERWDGNTFVNIGSLDQIGTTNIFFDKDPREGVNYYRAGIEFSNGESLYSYEISSFYLSKVPVIIYPNPAYKDDYLNILSKEYGEQEVTFTLYNQVGDKLRELKLISSLDYVPLDGLPSGLYVYRIRTSEGFISKGKLIIH